MATEIQNTWNLYKYKDRNRRQPIAPIVENLPISVENRPFPVENCY
ncbi:hypothetical protein [Microcoleus sp. herbarium14]